MRTIIEERHLNWAILTVLLFLGSAGAQSWPRRSPDDRRPFVPQELLQFVTVTDAQISPDGQWLAYTTSQVLNNETRSALWLSRIPANAAAGADVPRTDYLPSNGYNLAGTEWNPSSPRWSPDSKRIAFYGTVDSQFGVCMAAVADRSARFIAPVTTGNSYIAFEGESLAWAPDSTRLAYISRDHKPRDQNYYLAPDLRTPDVTVIDDTQYKARIGIADGTRAQVFVVDVDQPDYRRIPVQLTFGVYQNHALSWNPNGEEIAFISNHEPDPDANNNSDIFAVNLAGAVRQITRTAGCEYEPAWSPDGRSIAYIATTRPVTTIDSAAEDTHIWIVPATGGSGHELIGGRFDRRAHRPAWRSDSQFIYFLANDLGQTLIEGVGVNGSTIQVAPGAPRRSSLNQPAPEQPMNVHSFSLGKTFSATSSRRPTVPVVQIVTVMSDPTHPAEAWLALASPDGTAADAYHTSLFPLTNQGYLIRRLPLAKPEEFTYRTSDGEQIQAWIMKPFDWRGNGRYPLILSIHGGPHGAYGAAFSTSFQAYAAAGFGVLYLNPRGSVGYGQQFADATIRD